MQTEQLNTYEIKSFEQLLKEQEENNLLKNEPPIVYVCPVTLVSKDGVEIKFDESNIHVLPKLRMIRNAYDECYKTPGEEVTLPVPFVTGRVLKAIVDLCTYNLDKTKTEDEKKEWTAKFLDNDRCLTVDMVNQADFLECYMALEYCSTAIFDVLCTNTAKKLCNIHSNSYTKPINFINIHDSHIKSICDKFGLDPRIEMILDGEEIDTSKMSEGEKRDFEEFRRFHLENFNIVSEMVDNARREKEIETEKDKNSTASQNPQTQQNDDDDDNEEDN